MAMMVITLMAQIVLCLTLNPIAQTDLHAIVIAQQNVLALFKTHVI